MEQNPVRRTQLATKQGHTGIGEAEIGDPVPALLRVPEVGFALFDQNLRFKTVNAALARINQLSADAHRGLSLRDVYGATADQIEGECYRALETCRHIMNIPVSGPLAFRREIGRWLVNIFPRRDATGIPSGLSVVVVELAEKQQLEQNLAQLAASIRAGRSLLTGRDGVECHRFTCARAARKFDECLALVEEISGLLHASEAKHKHEHSLADRRFSCTAVPNRSGSESIGGKLSPPEICVSEREREVLRLLAEGHSNKQVADELRISVRTAETHRAHIMAKLKLHSIGELVRYAIRNEIIQP